jgi:CP family cyanate transporter-like MFS transporter
MRDEVRAIGVRSQSRSDTGHRASPRIAVASTLLMFSMMGVGFYGLPVYVATLSTEPRVGSTVAATAATVYSLVSGVAGAATGWLMRMLPLRLLLLAGAGLGSAALVLLGQSRTGWSVLVAMGGLGLGNSLAGLVPATTLIIRHYGSRAARLTVLATTSIPLSGMVVPPLASALIEAQGIGPATAWLGGGYFGMVCLAAGLLAHAPIDGPDDPHPFPTKAREAPVPPQKPPPATVIAWLALCVTAMFLVQNSMLIHIVALGRERGLANAAVALTVVSIVSLVARLLSIPVVDRVAIHRFAALVTAVQAIAAVILALASGTWAFYVGAAVLGFSVANVITIVPLLVSASTPRQHYASVYGIVWAVSVLLSAFGPLAVEVLRAWADGYDVALLLLGLVAATTTPTLAIWGRRFRAQPEREEFPTPPSHKRR